MQEPIEMDDLEAADLRYSLRGDFPDRLHMNDWDFLEGSRRRLVSPLAVREFFDHLSKGHPTKFALELAGIPLSAFKYWIDRGRSNDPKFMDFFYCYKHYLRKGQLPYLDCLQEAAKRDWKASVQYLTMVDPEAFGKKDGRTKKTKGNTEPTRVVQLPDDVEAP